MKRDLVISIIYIALLVFSYIKLTEKQNRTNEQYYINGYRDGTEFVYNRIREVMDSTDYLKITTDGIDYYFLRIDTIKIKK